MTALKNTMTVAEVQADDAATEVAALGLELACCVEPSVSIDAHTYSAVGPHTIQAACHQLFRDANMVVDHPTQHDKVTRYALTQKALEIARTAGHVSATAASVHGTCFQAEPRFARNVERQAQGDKIPTRLPAAILFDKDGEPFVYQKADGYPTAYAWRPGWLETQAGDVWIPSGAIVELPYGQQLSSGQYQNDPRRQYVGVGVVALRSGSKPDTARLTRLSVSFLPTSIKEIVRGFVTYDAASLGRYANKSDMLNSLFLKHMPTILQKDDLIVVGQR